MMKGYLETVTEILEYTILRKKIEEQEKIMDLKQATFTKYSQ